VFLAEILASKLPELVLMRCRAGPRT